MDKTILFLWLFLFCLAAITLCFLISAFFSRSKTAATLGTMIFFGCYFPYYAVLEEESPFLAKQAMCLFAPACMAVGANVIKDFETGGIGVGWNNWTEISESNFNFITVLGMLLFDTVLYGCGYIYLSKVLPSEYGTHRSPLYPCMAVLRCCSRKGGGPAVGRWSAIGPTGADRAAGRHNGDLEQSLLGGGVAGRPVVEPVSEALLAQIPADRTVNLRGLNRSFSTPSGIKHAVKRPPPSLDWLV